MVDADEDRDRTASDLAEAKREMRANKARLVTGRESVPSARKGTLAALPAAPKQALPAVQVEPTVAAVEVAPPKGAGDTGFVPSHSITQFLVAAALVMVLVVVWIVERRSSAKDMEDQDGR